MLPITGAVLSFMLIVCVTDADLSHWFDTV
jgi:hypothetical protein